MKNIGVDILLGVAIGDAVGVPYEFLSTAQMENRPAKDMVGFGTHNQPPGTWSDDSSLTFCLAEAIVKGYSLELCAELFVKWRDYSYWTAHNTVFDIGMTTSESISRLELCLRNGDGLYDLKYAGHERDNGNGSLMRILPLLMIIKGKPIQEQFEMVWLNSALTHRHIRAAMCCMIYLKFAEYIVDGMEKQEAYEMTRKDIVELWDEIQFAEREREHFVRVIQRSINELEYNQLKSGGYVMESIEASLWCFLNTPDYKQAILKSVNLGHDTDTTAAISGGLAGLYYGSNSIPEFWRFQLARYEDVVKLGEQLTDSIAPSPEN